jgi:hypothetical protein
VKVVDNDGLKSVEVLKLKVNGKIELQPQKSANRLNTSFFGRIMAQTVS